MPELRPFRGIRYTAEDHIKDLVCPPYDIISPSEQDALYERDPHNAIRLELAKEQGPQGYGSVAKEFERWLSDAVVKRDDQPSLYLYRQDFVRSDGTRCRVIGAIGALKLEEFGHDSGVLPHERTMPGPIADRLALLDALKVNVSPIYGIFRGDGALRPFYESLENRPTHARFVDEKDILHRLWVITAPAELEMLAAEIGAHTIVIADGHHRYETALTYHRQNVDEPGEHDAIMCFCVDADSEDLVVLPYNRAVKTPGTNVHQVLVEAGAPALGPLTPEEALEGSKADHPFVFVLPDGFRLAEVSDEEVVAAVGDRAPEWRALDVVALHEALLPRLFPEGVAEFRFSKDPVEITRSVRDEGWDCGVLLRALGAAQIVDVARSGERMPQKASYFWPKAITGLVFRSLKSA